jgi:hypothetical protein
MTEFAFSLRHNARRAAEKRLASGNAPAAAYTIEPADGGRFAIAWHTEAAPVEAPVEPAPAEAEAPASPATWFPGTIGTHFAGLPAPAADVELAAVITRLQQLIAAGSLTLDQVAEAVGLTAPRRRATRPTPASEPRRGKAREADEAAARGEAPAKPDVTSHANAHYQKRFDRLAELAAAGDWNGVADYQCNGVNTYAKMVRQYRDRLLTAHRATEAA